MITLYDVMLTSFIRTHLSKSGGNSGSQDSEANSFAKKRRSYWEVDQCQSQWASDAKRLRSRIILQAHGRYIFIWCLIIASIIYTISLHSDFSSILCRWKTIPKPVVAIISTVILSLQSDGQESCEHIGIPIDHHVFGCEKPSIA